MCRYHFISKNITEPDEPLAWLFARVRINLPLLSNIFILTLSCCLPNIIAVVFYYKFWFIHFLILIHLILYLKYTTMELQCLHKVILN